MLLIDALAQSNIVYRDGWDFSIGVNGDRFWNWREKKNYNLTVSDFYAKDWNVL